MDTSSCAKYIIGALVLITIGVLLVGHMEGVYWPIFCQQADIVRVPQFAGRLLFMQDVSPQERVISELTSDLDRPRVLYSIRMQNAKRSAYPMRVFVSHNRRLVVFEDGTLVNLESGNYDMLPNLNKDWKEIGAGAFSPDDEFFAYRLPTAEIPPGKIYLYYLKTKQSSVVFSAPCATYTCLTPCELCGYIGDLAWIDSRTIIFSHVGGMPTIYTGYQRKDTLTIKSIDGATLRSYHTQADFLGVAGSRVFLSDGGYPLWLDTSELQSGKFVAYKQPPFSRIDYSVSPDAGYGLTTGNPWQLTDMNTGSILRLGTAREFDPRNCVWSPDKSGVICQGVEPRKFGGCRFTILLIAPLSNASEQILLRSEDPVWEKWGDLLTWLPPL